MTWDDHKKRKDELEHQQMEIQHEWEREEITWEEMDKRQVAIDELIKELDNEFLEGLRKAHDAKEKAFQERQYYGSHVEEYLKWIADGKAGNGIWDDDYCYGENWEQTVPEYCRTPEKFYETTGYLEELFFHLSPFHKNTPGNIPRQDLYIRITNSEGKEVVLQISYITGQGSSLGVHIVENPDQDLHCIFNWTMVEYLAKMSSYQQAVWYIKNVIVEPEDSFDHKWVLTDSLFAASCFVLGQSIHTGFFEALNKKNFRKVMESCGI